MADAPEQQLATVKQELWRVKKTLQQKEDECKQLKSKINYLERTKGAAAVGSARMEELEEECAGLRRKLAAADLKLSTVVTLTDKNGRGADKGYVKPPPPPRVTVPRTSIRAGAGASAGGAGDAKLKKRNDELEMQVRRLQAELGGVRSGAAIPGAHQPDFNRQDVSHLSRALEDAQRRENEMAKLLESKEDQLAESRHAINALRRHAGHGGDADVVGLQRDLKIQRENALIASQKLRAAEEGLTTLKLNHEATLHQLEDNMSRFNQEHRERMRLETEARRLQIELDSARDTTYHADSLMREKLQLEKENMQLLRDHMGGSQGGLVELRKVSQKLSEVEFKLSTAEMKVVQLEGDNKRLSHEKERLQNMMESKDKEIHSLRSERDSLHEDIEGLKLSEAKALYNPTAAAREAAEARGELLSAPATPKAKRDPYADLTSGIGRDSSIGPDIRELLEILGANNPGKGLVEVNRLKADFAEQTEEIRRVTKLLHIQEKINHGYKSEVKDLNERLEKEQASFSESLKGKARELDRSKAKIQGLEAQMRKYFASGAGRRPEPGGKLVRISSGLSGDDRASSAGYESSVDDAELELGPDENVLEIHFQGAAFEDNLGIVDESKTFLSADFYEHETQTGPVKKGRTPKYDFTVLYIVTMDTFFFQYTQANDLTVELDLSQALDFKAIARASVPIRRVISSCLRMGKYEGKRAEMSEVEFKDVDGKVAGKLTYSAAFRHAVGDKYEDFLKSDAAAAGIPRGSAGFLPNASFEVTVQGCVGLVPSVTTKGHVPKPYVTFSFEDGRVFDTPIASGKDPKFGYTANIPVHRDAVFESSLKDKFLSVSVFDDADTNLEDAGLIGMAKIPLSMLGENMSIESKFPILKTVMGQMVEGAGRGKVQMGIRWSNDVGESAPRVYSGDDGDVNTGVGATYMPLDDDEMASRMEASALHSPREEDIEILGADRPEVLVAAESLTPRDSGFVSRDVSGTSFQPSADTLLITLASATFNAKAGLGENVEIFAAYEFLPDFTNADHQKTATIPVRNGVAKMGLSTAYKITPTGPAFDELKGALSEEVEREEGAILVLFIDTTKVSADGEFLDFGEAEIRLSNMAREGKDMNAARVPILATESREEIGLLTISIQGANILSEAIK